MSHLATVFGAIGMLYAIRCALAYSIETKWVDRDVDSIVWEANFAAWRLAAMGAAR